jgi:hypothetical protein
MLVTYWACGDTKRRSNTVPLHHIREPDVLFVACSIKHLRRNVTRKLFTFLDFTNRVLLVNCLSVKGSIIDVTKRATASWQGLNIVPTFLQMYT